MCHYLERRIENRGDLGPHLDLPLSNFSSFSNELGP